MGSMCTQKEIESIGMSYQALQKSSELRQKLVLPEQIISHFGSVSHMAAGKLQIWVFVIFFQQFFFLSCKSFGVHNYKISIPFYRSSESLQVLQS